MAGTASKGNVRGSRLTICTVYYLRTRSLYVLGGDIWRDDQGRSMILPYPPTSANPPRRAQVLAKANAAIAPTYTDGRQSQPALQAVGRHYDLDRRGNRRLGCALCLPKTLSARRAADWQLPEWYGCGW
ncbi:hypothetical protein MRX96_011413 [Rhipicephalus microplus]